VHLCHLFDNVLGMDVVYSHVMFCEMMQPAVRSTLFPYTTLFRSPWILRGYVFVPTVLFAAVTTANLPLYEAWGEKISKRAITLGMDAIGGVSNSIDFGMVWRGAVVLAVFFLCAHYFYHLVVVRYAKYAALPNRFVQAAALVVGAALIFSLIRGGYGRATLNQSSVYFSDDNIANHVA